MQAENLLKSANTRNKLVNKGCPHQASVATAISLHSLKAEDPLSTYVASFRHKCN
jgi:hypothetical protein